MPNIISIAIKGNFVFLLISQKIDPMNRAKNIKTINK